jgi:predicted nucleic acid-binding protein
VPLVVVDASTVVAALTDSGPDGRWAEEILASGPLAAPHLMPAEVANILRRAAMAGKVSADAASLAHADLAELRVELFPYEPFADRIWELRANLTCYDAWYVALAEFLECPLATLDARLAGAPGLKCEVRLPGVRI